MSVKKYSPLFVGVLLLALLTPLGATSLAQPQRGPAGRWRPLALHPTRRLLGGDPASAGLGSSIDNAGDVNGDGYEDLIAGAPLTDVTAAETTLVDAGSAILYYGSTAGLTEAGRRHADGRPGGRAVRVCRRGHRRRERRRLRRTSPSLRSIMTPTP